jgi:serine phosphatase RsbU (regulator of sigma subunit)
MENSHIIPLLIEITRTAKEAGPDTSVKEVVDIFQKDPALLALLVTEQGRFLGIVSRKTLFFQHLGHLFAMELYGKKPIRVLLDERPAVMGPGLDINSALARLLEVDPTLKTDSFPVITGDRCLGIVSVSDLMMKISENQARLLETLNSLSARIREEVAKASKIQQDLLPPPEFQFGGVSISAEVITSSEIGGDFYDYFCIVDDRLGLVVADVSGHGVQSGMVTTAAKASLHTLISQGINTPAALLHGMNSAILTTARQTLLMTCLIALIDLRKGELTLANAGHNFPYLYRKETSAVEMIKDAAGYPLGFEEDNRYEEVTTPFNRGDSLFLYTDGVVECMNREEEEFGYDRLEAFLQGHLNSPPDTAKRLLLETVVRFTGTASFEDDVTLLVATFHAKQPS